MSLATRAFAGLALLLLPAGPALAAKGGMSARSQVIVLAHRACWGNAPEVSVSAIEHCLTVGADAVEIDVRETRDGALILMHDESVDRTTDGSGLVAAMSAAEIRALRLKRGAGGPQGELTEEHVPTLEEGLAAARGRIIVNLHLKAPVQAKVAQIVRRMGMTGQVTTWVYGKPDDAKLLASPLRGAMGLIPTIDQCGPKYPEPCWPAAVPSLAGYAPLKPAALFIDFRQSHAFIDAVAKAKRPAGTRIFVETLGPVDALPPERRHAEWAWLLDHGVSMIMTDQPADLIAFLKTRPARKDGRFRLKAVRAAGTAH